MPGHILYLATGCILRFWGNECYFRSFSDRILARALSERRDTALGRHITEFSEGLLMSVAVVTASAGLIGSEITRALVARGLTAVGIDNDMRSQFFSAEASTDWQRSQLQHELGTLYQHYNLDIRDCSGINTVHVDRWK